MPLSAAQTTTSARPSACASLTSPAISRNRTASPTETTPNFITSMTLLLIHHRLAERPAVTQKRRTSNYGMASLPFWSHIQRTRDCRFSSHAQHMLARCCVCYPAYAELSSISEGEYSHVKACERIPSTGRCVRCWRLRRQHRTHILNIRRQRSRQETGRFNHPRNRPCPADRHDMNAAYTLDRQELLRQLAGDAHPLLLGMFGARHALDHPIGHARAGQVIAQELRRFGRANDHHAGKNMHLLVQAGGARVGHPLLEALDIEDDLSLDELGPALDLL